jgi:hypothetical protein
MYSNFVVVKEAYYQNECNKKKNDYLKCIKIIKCESNQNIQTRDCNDYLKKYIACLNYKNAPSIIGE